MDTCPIFISKHNSNREKQGILLIIPNGEHGIILQKKLSAFLRGKTLKNKAAFYCLNCLHSFR